MQTWLIALLETIINRYLQLDAETAKKFADLSGKVIGIEMPSWKLRCYLFPAQTGVSLLNHYEGEVDTTISGSPFALLRATKTKETHSQLFSNVTITGDLELGQQVRDLLYEMEIDWEEHLAKYTGDVVAHQVGNVVRSITQWGKNTFTSLRQNLTEYLQEEARHLPPRQEVEDFYSDIRVLQHDVERTEAQLNLLRNHKE